MKTVTAVSAFIISLAIVGCTPADHPTSQAEQNIPKITIVAKRMTDAQKLAYDQEMAQGKIDLAQR